MASIHIKELQEYLSRRRFIDVMPGNIGDERDFLEKRFDDSKPNSSEVVDEESNDRVITADSRYGAVTIYDSKGQLKSLEIC